jgi:site-specific DNA recombinase
VRCALYARYSDDRQNPRSIADQIALLSRHAGGRGWTITGVFSDAAISGTALANRPGLLNAVDAAERGEFDVLLAEDEDRFARNQEHFHHVRNRLEDAGVDIATLETDQVDDVRAALKGFMSAQYSKVLGAKTKRGMDANAQEGLATGSRIYGYRSAPGGAIEIVEAEAAIVRRILIDFAAGLSTRDIAAALNAEGVPGPRGGLWNPSTIHGSRQRGNGVLRTELYAGVKVWNRIEMRKDRRTGLRISRPRPPAEWKRTAVPQLRLVDEATWSAVQARLAASALQRPEHRVRRRAGIFSGLLKCGACGASYTVYNDGRLICAARRERGPTACSNGRTVKRSDVEQRILEGLRDRLLAPEAVAAYVRAYHQRWARNRALQADRTAPLQRRLGELGRGITRAVDAIVEGAASPAIKARLAELEAEKVDVEAQLAEIAADGEPPMELHPNAAQAYARSIEQLQARLALASSAEATPADRRLVDVARGLVQSIDIVPRSQARGGPVDLVLKGTLALFLTRPGEEQPAYECGRALVAGGGIEPPTCGL